VRALTDITGFGLAGHAHEMAHLSKLALRFTFEDLPRLPGVEALATGGVTTGGARRNEGYFGPFVRLLRPRERWQLDLLYDPQTSGPLLAAVDPSHAVALISAFRAAGEPAWLVGEAVAGPTGEIEIA
jgi:selenide,water dikinase